jgi:putative membrane protein
MSVRRLVPLLVVASMAVLYAAPAQGATTASAYDQTFMKMASHGNWFEVGLGKLANRSANATVKQLGTKLAADHAKSERQLRTIAASVGFKLPGKPSGEQTETLRLLPQLPDGKVDVAWLKTQRGHHTDAIALFAHAAKHADNAQLRLFAVKTLPVIRMHHREVVAALKAAT